MLNFFKTSSKASVVILPPMEVNKPFILPSPDKTNILYGVYQTRQKINKYIISFGSTEMSQTW